MHVHKKADGVRHAEQLERIALIGNPNVGKSVLFGLLTGRYATVSNYPGTTVEVTYGNLSFGNSLFLLVDTPGVNSLVPMSEDEQVTRDILLSDTMAKVLQVGDSKSLKRTLTITVQLAEMGLPTVLVLNMADEAMDRGITIDTDALARALGVQVVSTVAPERRGIRELRAAIADPQRPVPGVSVEYAVVIEKHARKIAALLPPAPISAYSLALMVLSADETLRPWMASHMSTEDIARVEELRLACEQELGRPVAAAIYEARIKKAGVLTDMYMQKADEVRGTLMAALGRASMHPVWGLPVLAFVLFGLYQFVGVLGADIMVGYIEEVIFGQYLNPMFTRVVTTLIPVPFFQEMLVGDYGVITMALTYAIGIILPITATFFTAFALLEDSGYLPRLAIMSNRVFNVMGLSGKAVLPMVLGLGCGTMAVMTTRILDTWRDRVIATFLLALAVPCAAQLGVIMGILGGLSASAFVVWIGVVMGILLLGGYLASKIVPGDKSDFLLEIPPFRVPAARNVLLKTAHRVLWYLKEAVPLFIYGTLALFLLHKLHALGFIERMLAPVVVGVLGLPERMAEVFLIGFFRRDYGAAGLLNMVNDGVLTNAQALVSLVTLTLFVPCLAHFLMMIKERGAQTAIVMTAIVLPAAVAAGALVRWIIEILSITV